MDDYRIIAPQIASSKIDQVSDAMAPHAHLCGTEEEIDDFRHLLLPPSSARCKIATQAIERVERFLGDLPGRPTSPQLGREDIRSRIDAIDFENPNSLSKMIDHASDLLEQGGLHCGHPRYLGLFNPTPTYAGIIADLLSAAYNPNLACWSHAPAAVEMEDRIIRVMGSLIGFANTAGHFTTGGAEANATAALCALTRAEPRYGAEGIPAFDEHPLFYASADSHLAWLKIAHQCGIGRDAVRLVPTDRNGKLDPVALQKMISEDLAKGAVPALIAATAGTTGAGMIDPLHQIADVAERNGAYFHVDAAWGGGALMSERMRNHLAGIERADSVTIDAHKWLAVPMGAGMFIGQDNDLLANTFAVSTSYMPPGATDLDYYTHSVQWSRRFIGLKFYLSLAALGTSGYARMVEHQSWLGNKLRKRLAETGWTIVNDTPLPVVCFYSDDVDTAVIADDIVASGSAWISTTSFNGRSVLRACISGFRTKLEDIEAIADMLDDRKNNMHRDAA